MNNTQPPASYYSDTSFFDAWLRGVEIAGTNWFKRDDWGASDVPSKWDYAPDHELIKDSLGVLSTGEAAFLAAMYSFYNSDAGSRMLDGLGLGSPGAVAAALDESRRRVIADLMLSYAGW